MFDPMEIIDKAAVASSRQKLFQNSGPLLDTIVHSSEDGIITKDLNGVITSWNPAAERIFGYVPEEIVGHSVLRLIPERLQFQEAEILSTLRAGQQIQQFETTRVRKDGQEIFVSLTISPVWDGDGKIAGVSKIVRDITAQKDIDLARLRLAAIVESADDAIVSKDLNGVVQTWNQGAERIFGYSAQEMIGRSILTVIPPELQSEEDVILGKIRRGERVEHFESIRLRKDGRRINISLTVSPLRDEKGTVIGASKIARDITQRKLLEERVAQAEKIAAGSKMAATIAHEINNPLEAVLNLIFLAKSSSREPAVAEYLNTAEGEMERLAHIAKQTLGFYREQNAATETTVCELVKNALRIYDSKLRSSGVQVQTEILATCPLVLRRGEMMQVISNLITNAHYAMPSGGRLMVRVEERDKTGVQGLLLTVRDTGVGIPKENLPRIFEPFFTTRDAIGTGIGLWVARRFVEGHGGSIDVTSQTAGEDRGTEFTIWLPRETPYAQESAA